VDDPDIEGAPDSDAPGAESLEEPAADASTRGASEADAPSTSSVAADAEAPGSEAVVEDEEPAGDAAQAEDDSDDEDASGPVAEESGDESAGESAGRASRRRRLPGRRRAGAQPEPPKPVKPAPSRRRARRDPNAPVPVVRAQAKYVRSSARKARLVCDHIRGKSVEEARAILAVTPRAIARDWSKLLESAVANAEHNHELVGEDLYVKAVHADEGPTIKRFRPRAMGRATRIRKRTSHLTILLTPKD
jgi:ribosomal protein L22